MKNMIPFIVLSILCLSGCSRTPYDEPDKVLKDAFRALKEENWEKYEALTVTPADIYFWKNRISPIKQELHYAGSTLKPEEKKILRGGFQAAAHCEGEECIDFKNSKFVSIGTLIEARQVETVEGVLVPTETYSIIIKKGKEKIDTKGLNPKFDLTVWNDRYFILGLRSVN